MMRQDDLNETESVERVRRYRRSVAKSSPNLGGGVMYMPLDQGGMSCRIKTKPSTKGLTQMVYLWTLLTVLTTVTNVIGNINNNQNNNNNNNDNVNLNIISSQSTQLSANTNNANQISIMLPPPIPVLAGGRKIEIAEKMKRDLLTD